MNEVIPTSNTSTIYEDKTTICKITDFVNNIFNKKKITPKITQSIDISNDITTYIRCLFHDFRGPMNNISLGIDVLLDSIEKNNNNYDILKNIKESCSFLSESLDGFLNIGNISDFRNDNVNINLEPFNIVGMIKKIQYLLMFNAMKKKVHIKYNITILHEWVIGDYKNIQHVLMNLISNAIKFSTDGSTIIIQLKSFKSKNAKQHIVISVVDENGFIDKKIKKNLFKKYNTSDRINGTGLGLYICKRIIEMNGGKITHFNNNNFSEFFSITNSVKNIKNGNVFQIELFLDICRSSQTNVISERNNKMEKNEKNTDNKLDMNNYIDISNNSFKDEAKRIESCITEENNRSNNGKMLMKEGLSPLKKNSISSINRIFSDSKDKNSVNIMVIDDSDISRKLLIRLLENNCKNIKIFDSIDGLDALIKIVQFKDTNRHKISMILVDNVMPNLTGELLCKILRGIGYDGLIIGITGNGLKDDKERFLDNGADYVFIKPFNKDKLEMLLKFIKRNGYDSKQPLKINEITGELLWKEMEM